MPIPIDIKDIVLLLAGGGLGYLLSLVAAKQTEKRKNLTLEVVGREIVIERTDACPFLVTSQEGENIDNVYFFVVRVWNKGRETVRGDEISPTAPLTIEIGKEARVLGEPQVMKPHLDMEFTIEQAEQNRFVITFDCLNKDEWVQIGFFVTGDPRTRVKGSGRVFGQHSEFDLTTDDSRARWPERAASLLAFLLIVTSPFALAGAIWWTCIDYQFLDLINNQEEIPTGLKILFIHGIFIPTIGVFYFASMWLKRKANPKGYPIREDFEPSQRQSLRAFFLTALQGKRYEVSTSVHDYGEIKPRTNEEPTNTNENSSQL